MTAAFSIYLDLVRFLAALAVFLDHLTFHSFSEGLLNWRLGTYGNVAVMIFFLLSGYVIAFVTSTREKTLKNYVIARFARLYSVVTIALLLTYLFDGIGMSVNPGFYANQEVLPNPPSWAGYLSSISFLNQFQFFGKNGVTPGSNLPFWSLSYEATYYVVAGLLIFAPQKFAYGISILLLGIAGIKIAVLLPIWFIGYFLFKTKDRFRFGTRTALILFSLSAVLIFLVPELFARDPDNLNFVQNYMTAFAFSCNLIAARQLLGEQLAIGQRIRAQARWLGAQTFPLYAIHYPALCLFAAISPWPRTSWANLIFTASSVLILVGISTPICDHLKIKLHQWSSAFATA